MRTNTLRAPVLPRVLAGLVAGVSVAAIAAAVDRETFEQHAPVSNGLHHLRYFGGMGMVPAPQEPSAEDRCWQAVLPDEGLTDANVDRCLQAAVKVYGDGAVFRRESVFPRDQRPAGVGIVVKLDEGRLALTDVVPGAPGERAGLQPGDLITAIDGRSVAGQTLDALVGQLRGQPDTSVRLGVAPAQGAPREVSVTRQLSARGPVYAVPLEGAFYLRVDSYTDQLVQRASELLAQAEQAGTLRGALVVDLRGNTGGTAQWIVNLAQLLAPGASPALYTVGARPVGATVPDGAGHWRLGDATRSSLERAQQRLADLPLVVLVDKDTGSGSEWLAETWRQQVGAVLVGQPSSAVAQVRQAFDAFEGARFEVPVGVIHAGGGLPVHGHGVQPHVAMPAEPVRLGRPPSWLQAWLRDGLPAALRARQAAVEAAPPIELTPSASWACEGPMRVPLAPSSVVGAGASERVELSVSTDLYRWDLSIASSEGADDARRAEEKAAMQRRATDVRQSVQRHIQELERTLKAQEKAAGQNPRRPPPAGRDAAAGVRAMLQSRQRLLPQLGVFELSVESPSGPVPALLEIDDARVTLAWWLQGREHVLNRMLREDVPAGLRAWVEQRLAKLVPLTGGAAPTDAASENALCLPGYRWVLDGSEHQVTWRQSLEQSTRERRRLWSMSTEFNLPPAGPQPPAMASLAVQEDDNWLLEQVYDGDRCGNGPLLGVDLRRTTVAGQPGVLLVRRSRQDARASGAAPVQACRELRAIRRLPWGASGMPWRAELTLRDTDEAALDALQSQWLNALGQARLPDAWMQAR
ncbi:S41 family peptidase [Ideonella sp. DXS29W]|uniref:S41 family peptidase n=1 Tax=Ideonella lacteola TaxID=2984193 RepID=A0ABU9BNR9_9BURK